MEAERHAIACSIAVLAFAVPHPRGSADAPPKVFAVVEVHGRLRALEDAAAGPLAARRNTGRRDFGGYRVEIGDRRHVRAEPFTVVSREGVCRARSVHRAVLRIANPYVDGSGAPMHAIELSGCVPHDPHAAQSAFALRSIPTVTVEASPHQSITGPAAPPIARQYLGAGVAPANVTAVARLGLPNAGLRVFDCDSCATAVRAVVTFGGTPIDPEGFTVGSWLFTIDGRTLHVGLDWDGTGEELDNAIVIGEIAAGRLVPLARVRAPVELSSFEGHEW